MRANVSSHTVLDPSSWLSSIIISSSLPDASFAVHTCLFPPIRNPERYKNFQNAGFCRMWRGFEPALVSCGYPHRGSMRVFPVSVPGTANASATYQTLQHNMNRRCTTMPPCENGAFEATET